VDFYQVDNFSSSYRQLGGYFHFFFSFFFHTYKAWNVLGIFAGAIMSDTTLGCFCLGKALFLYTVNGGDAQEVRVHSI
jgi:hypothetical protein